MGIRDGSTPSVTRCCTLLSCWCTGRAWTSPPGNPCPRCSVTSLPWCVATSAQSGTLPSGLPSLLSIETWQPRPVVWPGCSCTSTGFPLRARHGCPLFRAPMLVLPRVTLWPLPSFVPLRVLRLWHSEASPPLVFPSCPPPSKGGSVALGAAQAIYPG